MYKIDALLKQDQKLFHTRDLSLLWGVSNKNTLYTTIKRYVDKKILIPIHKGFYSSVPLKDIDLYRLGIGFLHTYGYVSCETILVQAGIIFQQAQAITLVSSKSVSFSVAGHHYISRKIKDMFLYNKQGIEMKNGVLMATISRAIADMVYLQPRYHFDNPKSIDWKEVKALQQTIGYL